MARGNQRDLARAKNLKKQADQKKQQKPDGKLLDRRERDAEAMRQKQIANEKKKQEQSGAGASN